jgi:hypothetical protein
LNFFAAWAFFLGFFTAMNSPDVVLRLVQAVSMVTDVLGKLGRIWREADADATDFETVIVDLLGGRKQSPRLD